MCGIVGYFGQGDKNVLEKMTRTLVHRGPDDEGFYNSGRVGLGQRRLSIIDLSPAGHQPMANEEKTVWLAFNGEIYNFKDLKNSLKDKHLFASQSDTEVILHLYEELGQEVFSKLEGMFAIALYDERIDKLFLARDRMGKKPLYYGRFGETLVFGSELKALMPHPLFKKELDLCALNKYLLYEYVPTPHSIFKNVFKLEPATYLTFDGREAVKKKFWNIEFNRFHVSARLSGGQGFGFQVADTIKELGKRLDKAVKDRLISDVPLGVFLSGGIDSSTIAYYAQKNSNQKIKTFSIGFKEQSFNEAHYARRVAEHLGTEHYEKILNAKDSLDLVPRIAEMLDEPLADASIIPTFLLSQFTRERVTVALGGDGGDELFCGYDTFIAHRLADIYEKLPLFLRKSLIERVALNLPTSFKNFSFDFKAKKFISGFYGAKEYRNQRWLGAFDRPERAELFIGDVWRELEKENEFAEIDSYGREAGTGDYYQQLIYQYLRTYMMDDILVKVDRASMFNSLEVRAPFLDTTVVDFANSLPLNLKLRGLTTKFILKKLMEDKLPKEIVQRKKKGFGVPLAEWLADDLEPLITELFSEKKINEQGLFNYQYINKLLDDHFSRRTDNRKLIWTLAVFQMWQEKWL
ncbi:MAG: asparagine synthase (glutamine-hydrolyzing) [Parcubacteria group bacterium]